MFVNDDPVRPCVLRPSLALDLELVMRVGIVAAVIVPQTYVVRSPSYYGCKIGIPHSLKILSHIFWNNNFVPFVSLHFSLVHLDKGLRSDDESERSLVQRTLDRKSLAIEIIFKRCSLKYDYQMHYWC